MKPRRVVITGVGIATPIGNSLPAACQALQEGRSGIVAMPEWDKIVDLRTRLAGVVQGVDLSAYPRKKLRTMGRVARLAAFATDQAITASRLDQTMLQSGSLGLAYGSTSGSSESLERFCGSLFTNYSLRGLSSTGYLKFMSHTCAANLGQFFHIQGRVISTCSACTSGSQAIGCGYEAIKFGLQDVMICGGAEEMHFATAVTFDLMYATSSTFNQTPEQSPRPFDQARDGLVIGEGAGTLVLEDYDHAMKRGAPMLAEIIGYGTNCDGRHMTSPSERGMREAMLLALRDANLSPADIDYINAHGTATEVGDIAESKATQAIFSQTTPFSSTKGHIGHTLGACGAIEAAFCLGMFQENFLAPTKNLTHIDPRCATLAYLQEPMLHRSNIIMSNNFAFGGVNTSLIFRRLD